jgi:Helicase HerA, central domain
MTSIYGSAPLVSPPRTPQERLRDASVLLALLMPALVIGAVFALPFRQRRRMLWCCVAVCSCLALGLYRAGAFQPGWEWVWLSHRIGISRTQSPGKDGVLTATLSEALWGPLWAAALPSATTEGAPLPRAHLGRLRRIFRAQPMAHPRDSIRLGMGRETGRPVDLALGALMRGCAVFGVTGSGKSTALRQIASGAIASGAAVLVLDGKGPSLRLDMETVARLNGVAYYSLDAADPATYRYNTLEGTSSRISNKLLGALIPTASSDASIYKAEIQGAAPYILDGLEQAHRLTLRELHVVLSDPARLAQLARETGNDDLRALAARAAKDRLLSSALSGMAGRLASVSAGHFRELLEGTGTEYSWAFTDEPSMTYLSLPSLEAIADAAVMCRVALSDLAQKIATRQSAIQGGAHLPPLVIILDELTALSASDPEIEPRVLSALLQAREAQVAIVVAGQTLPLNPNARQAILGAGVLLALRMTAADCGAMADEFGTRPSASFTHQVENGQRSGLGTMTMGHAYLVNPQELRLLAVGEAVLFIPPGAPIRLKISQNSASIPSGIGRLLRRCISWGRPRSAGSLRGDGSPIGDASP